MDFNGDRKYELELWSITGVKIADISHLAKGRKYSMQRNEAETLEFTLDLDVFEAYCAKIGTHPRNVLAPYQTEVKLKRNGVYLFGTQVIDAPISLSETESSISVKCTGYLNLFKDRYITKSYPDTTETTTIASDMLLTTQAQPNGNMGVTISPTPYITGVPHERNYVRDNIKDRLKGLTNLVESKFDFDFSADKVFRTYAQIGSVRNDVFLTYPYNIKSIVVERTGSNIFNKLYGVGSGFGADQVTATVAEGITDDSISQLAYYLREKIVQFNSVVEQTTLDQNTSARLAMLKDVLEIVKVTVTGNEFDLNYVGIGDRIRVAIQDHPFVDNVDGMWRVERMEVAIDDNDFETDIQLYFDNLGVDQNE